jgi:hypothetical protein
VHHCERRLGTHEDCIAVLDRRRLLEAGAGFTVRPNAALQGITDGDSVSQLIHAPRGGGPRAELATAANFLEELALGSAALVKEGEAGISKTTLWLEVVKAAEARG